MFERVDRESRKDIATQTDESATAQFKKNVYSTIDAYFNSLKTNLATIHDRIKQAKEKKKQVIFFPCHINIQFMNTIDEACIAQVKYAYDNNKDKHGKRLHGTNIVCVDKDYVIEHAKEIVILLLGSFYNKEVTGVFDQNGIEYHTCM